MPDVDRIREIICEIGNLATIDANEELMKAGFTSMSVLQLLTELESEYSVDIPDERFMNARTPRDLDVMIHELRGGSIR